MSEDMPKKGFEMPEIFDWEYRKLSSAITAIALTFVGLTAATSWWHYRARTEVAVETINGRPVEIAGPGFNLKFPVPFVSGVVDFPLNVQTARVDNQSVQTSDSQAFTVKNATLRWQLDSAALQPGDLDLDECAVPRAPTRERAEDCGVAALVTDYRGFDNFNEQVRTRFMSSMNEIVGTTQSTLMASSRGELQRRILEDFQRDLDTWAYGKFVRVVDFTFENFEPGEEAQERFAQIAQSQAGEQASLAEQRQAVTQAQTARTRADSALYVVQQNAAAIGALRDQGVSPDCAASVVALQGLNQQGSLWDGSLGLGVPCADRPSSTIVDVRRRAPAAPVATPSEPN